MHECDQVLDMAFLVAACVACSGFQSKRFSTNFPATPLLFSKMFDLKDCGPGKLKASPLMEAVSMAGRSPGGFRLFRDLVLWSPQGSLTSFD